MDCDPLDVRDARIAEPPQHACAILHQVAGAGDAHRALVRGHPALLQSSRAFEGYFSGGHRLAWNRARPGRSGSVKNFVGGIVVLADRPYQLGDRVRIGDAYGEIDHIGLRSTKLTTPDDTHVTIPNAQILSDRVFNANSGVPDCQVVTDLFLPVDTDPDMALKVGLRSRHLFSLFPGSKTGGVAGLPWLRPGALPPAANQVLRVRPSLRAAPPERHHGARQSGIPAARRAAALAGRRSVSRTRRTLIVYARTAGRRGLYRSVEQRILGKTLERIRLASPFLLRTISPALAEVEGRTVRRTRRIGKRIAIGFEGELWLVLHLMIAGRLHWRPPGVKLPAKRALAAFDFDAGSCC